MRGPAGILDGIRRRPPCKGCVAPKRHMGCHDTCPEYRAWRVELDAAKTRKAQWDEVFRLDGRRVW